jgi:hypothetical protein
MRRALFLIPLLIACAKSDTAQTDSAAMAPAMAAALTDADVAGTWTGTSMPAGSDSVVAHWTQVCGGGTCRGTSQESKDTVVSSYTLSGDSAVGVSQPYTDPAIPGVKVIDNWVVRIQGTMASGTGSMALASKPDSVVFRYRFEGTRAP